MSPLLAVSNGVVFAIGAVVFIAVATAAFGLGLARFAEFGEPDRTDDERA
jgi:hypothetical protein